MMIFTKKKKKKGHFCLHLPLLFLPRKKREIKGKSKEYLSWDKY